MGHIFRNLKAIPIPADAHVNNYDGRIFYEYKRSGTRQKKCIGVVASAKNKTMHVNENFRSLYPELWQEHYGQEVLPAGQIHAGLYAVALSIGLKTGLYPLVQQTFGPQHGNIIMDFAMYCMRERNSTAQLFSQEMNDQMLFSRKAVSDTKLSELFAHEISPDKIHQFRTAWLKHCAQNGTKRVWICIDGSNNDCAVQESELAQRGHAKSLKDTIIVSYMWAVDAKTGRPITWFVNKGGMPDCKAVDEVIRFLASSDIQVEGVILDRGFASEQVLDLIDEKKLHYIVMLKSNTNGYVQMALRHADDIRWNVRRYVSDDGIFGITDQVKVFANSKKPSTVALFFVSQSSATRFNKLARKIRQAQKLIRKDIALNKSNITVPAELKNYLKLTKDGSGKVAGVEYDYEAWQKTADSDGYHAIASSQDLTAEEIHDLYQLRDTSEKQYSLLKSQMNGDVTRVHSDEAICARLAVHFIASAIRTELMLACKSMELDTNVMLRKLDDAHMTRMTGGRYEAVRTYGTEVNAVLGHFGINFSHLQKFAEEINDQDARQINDQERELPEVTPPKRGRKKGSKNKKTLEREAKEAALRAQATAAEQTEPQAADETPKRGRGRPKGSKNKKTLRREAKMAKMAAAGIQTEQPKRRPGRPKGSKNKRTLEMEARARRIAEGRRGPGRPKGSKNKPTVPSSTVGS